jgi:beta-mannosidase
LDWGNAEAWPDYWQANQVERFGWMESVYWIYRTRIDARDLAKGERLFLVCEGVDYQFLVKLNGVVEYAQEGMFTPFEIELTNRLENEALVEVIIFPVPDSGDFSSRQSEGNASVKPVAGYGCGIHPRLLSSGIWKSAYLEKRQSAYIESATLNYWLEEDLTQAHLDLSVEIRGEGAQTVQWVLSDPNGEVSEAQSMEVEEEEDLAMNAELIDPLLWWPNGMGRQNLYTLLISLHDESGTLVSQVTRSVGFKRVRLLPNPLPEIEPGKAESLTLEVNRTIVFCKGAIWAPAEIFPGVMGGDTYRPLLELAKAAHFNLLRCWGGGPVNKEPFFEQCDELGLMVWQEFPLANNRYSETPEFLDTLNRESRSIVAALKSHVCLTIWGSGSERFDSVDRMSEQHPALRLLNANCYELDPETPFIASCALVDWGSESRLFLDSEGFECFERIQTVRRAAYPSFGCSGVSSADYLRRFMPEEELFPVKESESWKAHHAVEASDEDSGAWLCLDTIVDYFGRPESIEEIVRYGQTLQVEGLKAMFEEMRRQKPVCSMALCWCLNEPWPSAANNSLVNWPAEPKPAYDAARKSCRPILASACVPKFAWKMGEIFEAEMWILNDAWRSERGGMVEAYLKFDDEERFALEWNFDSLEPNRNQMGPILRVTIPRLKGQTFQLELRVEARPEWNSQYEFCYQET